MTFADPMFTRMFWKEYREQRSYWLSIAGAALGLMLLMLWLPEPGVVRNEAPWGIALFLPVFFALGSSAMAFASEHEAGTTDLLRSMAARTGSVFFAKIALSVLGTVGMWTFLLAVARLATGTHEPRGFNDQSFAEQFVGGVAFTLQLAAWGFLFSLLCRKVLTAVFLAALVSLCCALPVQTLLVESGLQRHMYLHSAPAIPLLLIAWLLTARMMSVRSLGLALPFEPKRAAFPRTPAAETALDRLAAGREIAPPWRRLMARLAWLEFRQAASLGHGLWIAALFVLVFLPIGSAPAPDPGRAMFGAVLVAFLIGIWSFQTEGARRTRFIAERGLPPQAVWLSKQLVWGLVALAIAVPFVVAVGITNVRDIAMYRLTGSSIFHSDVPGASAVEFAAMLACLAYGAGQFASMLLARAMIAAFFGFLLLWVLGLWTWLMIELQIPPALSTWPVVFILLATTLGWSRRWLLESASLRSWVRLAAALSASVAAVWGSVGMFRVWEVPQPAFVIESARLRESSLRPDSTEEITTANLYRKSAALLWFEGNPMQAAVAGWEHVNDREREWLDRNRDALAICLDATERPAAALHDLSQPFAKRDLDANGSSRFIWFAELILLSARELESQGKLDEALDRYVAVLRLARHVASRGAIGDWSGGAIIEERVAQWIRAWTNHPDQTSDRIAAAARRIEIETRAFPSLRDAVVAQQRLLRYQLLTEHSDSAPLTGALNDPKSRTMTKIIERFCPWEPARADRALNLYEASQLYCVDVLEQALAMPGRDMRQLAEITAAVPAPRGMNPELVRRMQLPHTGIDFGAGEFFNPGISGVPRGVRIPWNWLATTVEVAGALPPDHAWIWQPRQRQELTRRIMILRLKLAAFKKAQDKYPDQIEWPGFGIDAIDPYTGASFGYRPEGFRTAVRVVNGLTHREERLDAGTPIIWSAGPANARVFTAIPTEEIGPEQLPDQTVPARTSVSSDTSPLAFPLP
ncbi:MAG: ABC transporter permease [Planctomycetia bacterium]|nr:ABC transporter permease [Planctomycetia bacterium]